MNLTVPKFGNAFAKQPGKRVPLRVELSLRARSDLGRQYEWYLEHADVEIAEKYREAVDATVQVLASFPGLGVKQNFKSIRIAGARSYRVEAPFDVHLIFYRADDTTLLILRVMHGARDLPRRLRE